MNPARLRHTVTIQQPAVTQDENGAEITVWVDFATGVRAAIEPLNGRELFAAQAVQAETTGRVTIRYLAGVGQAMRVVHDSKYYGITAIIDPELRHRELQLMVSEGVLDGGNVGVLTVDGDILITG